MKMQAGILILVMLSAGCDSSKPKTVSLYAAAGLRDAVEVLRAGFSRQTGMEIEVDYAGSGVVLARVQKDPSADLFLPADVWYVDRLNELAGLVEESVPVAQLIPVLIVAKGNPKDITSVVDLTRPDVKTAMGNPKACQIGRLSKLMLDRAGLDWEHVVDEESLTVNELAIWVKMNAADAAVVWASTAATVADSVEVIELEAKPDEISMVNCALIKTAPNAAAAQAFIQFMAGPEGQQIFVQTGFAGVEKTK
ncbi:Putative binding protein [Pontiella desulfatans]|uniref:Binding protein n=1 Tax=Pontiella desulfatans TaxID=2750659 RepID=A0A6C2U6M3_PONDE|nr:molybdate ABC transporter substrate-binding protein [Pontiella desulfatans]VGO15074.1 Putative binding protein [Pontiella desulfatans]